MSTAKAAGHGAAKKVKYISGGIDTRILWPTSSIPRTFTVCSVTRYTGAARGRILSCKGSPGQSKDWLHGHWSRSGGCAIQFGLFGSEAETCPTGRGRAYYGNQWNTDNFAEATYQEGDDSEESNHGAVDDWLVMCGTNGGETAAGDSIVIDQNTEGTAVGGHGSCRLNIGYREASDWALHSLFIWDTALGTPPPVLLSPLSLPPSFAFSPSLHLPLPPSVSPSLGPRTLAHQASLVALSVHGAVSFLRFRNA